MRTPRVSNLLREYFEHEISPKHFPLDFSLDVRSLPVSVKSESKWFLKQAPERLCRSYDFSNRASARQFLSDLMDFEEERDHHAEIRCKGSNVTVEVYTHGVECVTELDKEYANESERIYNDICASGYR
jgi:pterin-4a-carbinolamine dehydratase